MEFNFLAILVAAAIPIVIRLFWYNPKTFGIAWMRESGMTEEQFRKGNLVIIFGVSLVLSLLLAFSIQSLVIHQFGAFGMIGAAPETAEPSYQAFINDYGNAYRTFKHGALHGFISGVFIIFPVIAITALFERRSWKYIFINTGFWILCLTIMGAIVCGWV